MKRPQLYCLLLLLPSACADDAFGSGGSSGDSSGTGAGTTDASGSVGPADTTTGPGGSTSEPTTTGADTTDASTGSTSGDASSSGEGSSSGDASSTTGGFNDACPYGEVDPELPTLFGSNTAFANDDFTGSCGGAGQPDRAYTFTAPSTGTYSFSTAGSLLDTVVYVLDGECAGDELACNDNAGDGTESLIELDLVEGQTVTLVIDTAGEPGVFSVNVLPGRLSCPQGALDTTLPAVVSSSTVGHLDNLSASCGGDEAPDTAFTFTAPATATYAIDALGTTDLGFVALYVLDGVCGGAEIFCGSPAGAFVDLVEGQTVTIVVDGWCCDLTTDVVEIQVSPVGGTCPDEILGGPQMVMADTAGGDNTTAGTCGGVPSPDTGYQFTAPNDGFFVFETIGSALDTVVYVRDGGCDGVELGCNDNVASGVTDSRVTTRLDAGQTVVATVDGANGSGAYTFAVAEIGCIDTTLPQMVPQTVVDTFLDGYDRIEFSCTGPGISERNFAFTAPADGIYAFDAFGSTADAVISVREGIACDGAELACNVYGSFTTMSPVTVPMTAGQTVTVSVERGCFFMCSEESDFQLNVNVLEGGACPDTDLGQTVPQSLSGATDEPGDDDTIAGSCGGIGTADDIFLFTAPSGGIYTFDTEGSAADTILQLRGACDGPEIVCNDNVGNGMHSHAAIWLETDETIIVAVDGNTAGAYELAVDTATCPQEDLGNMLPVSVTGNTSMAADLVLAESCFGADSGSPDVSYGWTVPADGTYVFDMVGSDYDTFLLVQAEHCGGAEVGCNDDTIQLISQVTLDLSAGQFVIVTASGFGGATGNYVLNINQL